MSRYHGLSKLDIIGLLEAEEADHRATKAILDNLRRDNLMLERRNAGDTSEEVEDYFSNNISPGAHHVQGLENQIVSMVGIHESERHVFQSQLSTYKQQIATSKKLNQDLVAKIQELDTENRSLKANAPATMFQQQNFGAAPVINNFYGIQTAAAPATPVQAPVPHRALAELTIADDGDMEDDDGIEMPQYKGRCDLEYNGQCHRRVKCNYLHQAQIDKFPTEDIARLPVSCATAHRAAKRKRVA
jgi:hypothetical protein